ncbi:pleiotropic regulator 1 isoform X2 [Wyeomyia smithii]|uniref:pleiotropic regulator 1 isoform X2 n=1 Tax=Wyeomyia smithii TaxID=174621 RepID=UPI002467E6D6|nr:pleiotropic regulator 1 isoform X2 [Wyeomyia smithii]
MEEVQRHSVHTLVFRSLKRTHDFFVANQALLPEIDEKLEKMKYSIKARDSYKLVFERTAKAKNTIVKSGETGRIEVVAQPAQDSMLAITAESEMDYNHSNSQMSLVPAAAANSQNTSTNSLQVLPKKAPTIPKPKWHAPWKLYRVISGHLGWVRCVAVEPGNEWFATGAADRVIKVWDLASGKLKLSLTGHVSTVRGLCVSPRHPYLFSCGEDRQVKCWDLEYNKVIRHYHGHLSAVYTMALHPTIDVLVTAGRDSTARVWDMRTKVNVHTLTGHTNTVASVVCQAANPQIITGSHDSTVRLWDLAAGKSMASLTNHKKSVRSIVLHPSLYMFASASPDNIKQWRCPEGNFIQNLNGHNAIVNCMAVNPEGVLVSGGDNGTMFFWDWRTGYNFQRFQAAVQPGSMDSEAGIFSMTFDMSGSRLITTEADKTIKIYKEDDGASEESHPVNWRPEIIKRRKY